MISNRNPIEWLRLMRALEENFPTEDDKTEYELANPRYIEQLLDEDEEAE